MRRIVLLVLLVLIVLPSLGWITGCEDGGVFPVFVPVPPPPVTPTSYSVVFHNRSFRWGLAVVVDGCLQDIVSPRTALNLTVPEPPYTEIHHYYCDMVDACGVVVYRSCSGTFSGPRDIYCY